MSLAKVLRLEDYRGKRAQRLSLADTLHSSDPSRLAVFRYLTEISGLCEADRVATVWVDEYGPGSVHPHVVLDVLMDRPRRFFSPEPLRRAWELGAPGAIDELADPASSVPATFAISLGSDGMRAWFLVAETAAGRPLLQSAVRNRIMFLAGECAAVVLHRDLDKELDDEPDTSGFAGWGILKDLEGRETDEEAGRRIAQRFVVGRMVRMVADDGFVPSKERVAEQARRARLELPDRLASGDQEAVLWHRTLDVLEDGDVSGLADVLVELAEVVERMQHVQGALELYDCAYEAATVTALPRAAAQAAFHSGRILRRGARRDEARERYEVALGIAEAAGMQDIAANVLVGLSLMKRDLGNIPAARSGLETALVAAEGSGNPDAIAIVHHAFLGLEQIAGNVVQGLEHGWVAVATYESAEKRWECMAGLAAALMEYGDRAAAEDAWTLVAHGAPGVHYRIYAHDALGHLAALRGDEATFDRQRAVCEDLKWETAAPSVKVEVLQHRGLSYEALGRYDLASEWLSRAVDFAQEHGFNRVTFEAERALEAIAAGATERETTPTPAAPMELREGLRSMRQELVGVGG